jgi:hypothetical protein
MDDPTTPSAHSLTGIWHGVYTYPGLVEPVYFVATLLDGGSWLSGTTHETCRDETGATQTFFASVWGGRRSASVAFTKTYDGTGGWHHAVTYDGTLNADATEIEGQWRIGTRASGRFLMQRGGGASEQVVREAFEKV